MAFVAKQLRAAEDAQPLALEEPSQLPPPFQGGALFGPQDLAGWDESVEEDVFIGPIRRSLRIKRERPPEDPQ